MFPSRTKILHFLRWRVLALALAQAGPRKDPIANKFSVFFLTFNTDSTLWLWSTTFPDSMSLSVFLLLSFIVVMRLLHLPRQIHTRRRQHSHWSLISYFSSHSFWIYLPLSFSSVNFLVSLSHYLFSDETRRCHWSLGSRRKGNNEARLCLVFRRVNTFSLSFRLFFSHSFLF